MTTPAPDRETNRARKKLKIEQHTATIADVENAYSVLREELGEEMRSWYDNMSDNLQGGDKGSQVDEAANTLGGLDCPDIPDGIADLGFTYTTQHRGGKKGDPRWLRRDNEVSAMSAAVSAVREWVDEANQAITDAGLPDDAEDKSELTWKDATYTLGELKTTIEEAETFCDELEGHYAEAEGVEFPGMYG